ncbi:MAG TPA: Ig-like domain-containing protein [Anaerolineae bacterium]|nr:Ig-like domain-containing protein [Anaerolineae bacterium]
MFIDSPTEAANVEGIVTVGGWAIDRASTSDTGVSQVHIYLDGTAGGGGTGLGVAAYGGDRPDVAAVYGDRFRYSGYNYSWNSNTTSLGEHTLYVYVYSTIAASWSHYQRQVNVVDTTAPTSAISTLPETMTNPTFTLTWSGNDNGTGIATYDVQVRDGADGTWQNLLVDTTKTTQKFTGQVDHTYYFRCRATDLAGNVEIWPNDDGDTYTHIKGFQVFLPIVLLQGIGIK